MQNNIENQNIIEKIKELTVKALLIATFIIVICAVLYLAFFISIFFLALFMAIFAIKFVSTKLKKKKAYYKIEDINLEK